MSTPVQEPTTYRAISRQGFVGRQLERRPRPPVSGVMDPWVRITAGATTAVHNTFIPIPFEVLEYDPALVVQGDVFDWVTTDTGDTGNFRFELKTLVEGWYEFHLRTSWGQITSNGTEDFAYYMEQLRIMNTSETTTFYENRASADWLRDDIVTTHGLSDAPGEQYNNPYLNLNDVVWMAGTRIYKPRGIQSTGDDRDLNGDEFMLIFRGPTDSSTWISEIVAT